MSLAWALMLRACWERAPMSSLLLTSGLSALFSSITCSRSPLLNGLVSIPRFSNSYLTGLYPLFAFIVGWGQFDKTKYDTALKQVEQAFTWLETHFNQTGKQFLVNDRITLADIILCCNLSAALQLSLSAELRAKFPKVDAYLHRFFSNDKVVAVVGEFKFNEHAPAQASQ